jgi:hypothetical protein
MKKFKNKNLEEKFTKQTSLFSLDMFTYTYKRLDIKQIALKRLPGEKGECRKKRFVRFSPPFTCYNVNS